MNDAPDSRLETRDDFLFLTHYRECKPSYYIVTMYTQSLYGEIISRV